MKHLRKLFAALLLILVMVSVGFACGDMNTPPCPCSDTVTNCGDSAPSNKVPSDSKPTIAGANVTEVTAPPAISSAAFDMYLMVLALY